MKKIFIPGFTIGAVMVGTVGVGTVNATIIDLPLNFSTTQGSNNIYYEAYPDNRPINTSNPNSNSPYPLPFVCTREIGNGSVQNIGPTYADDGNKTTPGYPYIHYDSERKTLLMHPGEDTAASIQFIVPQNGFYKISGDFARANNFQYAGNGVDVVIFRGTDPGNALFSSTIAANHLVDTDNYFGGTGVAHFDFGVNLAQGEALRFAVFCDSQGQDGSFDVTALQVAIAQNVSAISMTGSTSASAMVSNLIGEGISVVKGTESYTGVANQSGFFSGGGTGSTSLGIDSGVVLSSGNINFIPGRNKSGPETRGVGSSGNDLSTNLGTSGDNQLNTLSGFQTYDAAVLSFDFKFGDGSTGGDLYFNFVFSSEEYIDYIDSQFNDVFGFFIDGLNIANIPGTSIPISVNTVNDQNNPTYYRNNVINNSGIPVYHIDTKFDGMTSVITMQAKGLSPGTHSMKFAIADTSDNQLDAAVFLQAGTFSATPTDNHSTNHRITSSGQAYALPINGSLQEQIFQVNFGPPAYNHDEWKSAHRQTDNHAASSFLCSEVQIPLNEPFVSANKFLDGADEVTYNNCSSAFYKFTFTIPNGSHVNGGTLKVNVDDMAVAYLNGYRISPKITEVDFLSEDGRERKENDVPILAWPNMDTLMIDSSRFVAGENVLVFGVIGDAITEFGTQYEPTGVEFSMEIDIKDPTCKGDFDGDGDIDGNDLSAFSSVFGDQCSENPAQYYYE